MKYFSAASVDLASLEVAGEDVGGKSHCLERDVDRAQVFAGRHEQHPDPAKRRKEVVLPPGSGRSHETDRRRERAGRDRRAGS